ncbi:DNA-binding transcriptional regulator, AcrR family [Amycolatopsis xylanica]|uniref:DNA-binding transcriptional regulator, AcrR family n=1 Tax=Amycolatopsis xylanica TaxID=589385 RepID=A0A1H3SLN4_9PSEU|nr:TetR/AcrR family transcriptional regulator [Amycolatopsis xylanica]SDZ38854.1 DNA-binding transcriptional regulator, AcrR family [Amycolatopsis xylanica]
MTKTPTRDRLLDTAAEFFYRDGVHIGIDALCKAAGVSKRSMYQLFDTKDEVMAASLDRIAGDYEAKLLPPADDGRSHYDRVLYVFEQLDEASATDTYRGCPFVSTAFELKDPEHPASVVARRHKQSLTDFFRAEAELAGITDPDLLAIQLTMVFDGAGARVVVRAEPLRGLAKATATAVLAASGWHGSGQ